MDHLIGLIDILGSAKKTLILAVVGLTLLFILKSGGASTETHDLLSGLLPSIYEVFGGFLKTTTSLLFAWAGILFYKGRI